MIKNPKFVISADIYNKCSQFAKDSVGTSADKYAKRNQNNISKITNDIICGKVAEQYVYETLKEIYPNLSQPDYNVYEKKLKNFSADLSDESIPIKIGVKSQNFDSEQLYGCSFVFQGNIGKKYDSDTGVFGEKDDSHFISFVSLNMPKRIGEIRAIVKVSWLIDNKLFKPMQLKNLQGNKCAVYFSDLEAFDPGDLWQI